jgi:hypothetical protein
VFEKETRQRFAADLPGLLATLTSVVVTELIDCAATTTWSAGFKDDVKLRR